MSKKGWPRVRGFGKALSVEGRNKSSEKDLSKDLQKNPFSTIAAALACSALILSVILTLHRQIHKHELLELRLAYAQTQMSELGTVEEAILDKQNDTKRVVTSINYQRSLVDGALSSAQNEIGASLFEEVTPLLKNYYQGIDRIIALVRAGHYDEARTLDAQVVDAQGEAAEKSIRDLSSVIEDDGSRVRLLSNLITIVVVLGTSMAWAFASKRAERLSRAVREERVREEAGNASQKRFSILVERAADMIAVVDPKLRFAFVSQASNALIGTDATRLAGRPVAEGFPCPGAWPSILAAIDEVREHPGAASRCEVMAVVEGREKFIEVDVANLTAVPGIEGFVLTCHDVTIQRQAVQEISVARDRALEAAVAKSQFLANMSHEIRTPMNGVIGMVELMLDTPLSEEQIEFMRIVRTSADSLLDIINDILDFSKLEAGKMLLDESPTDLCHLIEDIGEMLSVAADEKGIELLVALPEHSSCQVVADPLRMRQVLINLVNNALKFTQKGEVVLGVNKLGETAETITIEVYVRDSGIGISEENQRKIFHDFTQADGSITRQYGGTGLGLTISQSLAKLMGGEIKCVSTLGEGSTFSLVVTVRKAEALKELHPHDQRDFEGKRVLIVDDNAVNRQILSGFVRSWGSVADEAESGFAGLEILKRAKQPYDLILLDFQMPEMDGLETAKRIQELGPNSLVLMLSSVDSGKQREFLDDAGIHARLMKPVRKKELLAAIKSASINFTKPSPQAFPRPQNPSRQPELGLNVLLVEDNPVNQLVAKKMLERLGCTMTIVDDGLQAVVATSQRDYDVILMDCEMPVMDGYVATRSIRERERSGGKRHTIIALTAHALEGSKEKCLGAGMDGFITKPLKFDPLLAALEPLSKSAATEVAA